MSARWSDTRALAGNAAPAACGFVLGSQVFLWPLLSRPLAAALSPDPAALLALLILLATLGRVRTPDTGPTRILLPFLPCVAALLGLLLAPWCRAMAPSALAADAGRIAVALVVFAPSVLLATAVLRSAPRWPAFWWGATAGWGVAATLAGSTSLRVLVPLCALPALAAWRPARAATTEPVEPPRTSVAFAAIFAWTCGGLAVFGLLRFTLHLGGLQARGRTLIVAVGLVAVALSTALAGRFGSRRTLASTALLGAALWALVIVASTGGLLPHLVLRLGGGLPPAAALVLALLLWTPVVASVTVALASRSEDTTIGAAAGLGLALLIDELLLPTVIDPGRALVLTVLILSLGAALQAALALGGRAALARGGVAAVLGAASLVLPPPDLRLLATDLAWAPGDWAPQGRPSIADRSGRRRVDALHRDRLGVAARLTVAGHPERILWRGVPVLSLDPLEETSRFRAGFLVGFLHAAPRLAVVNGIDSGALAHGLRAAAPGLEVASPPLTPALAAVLPTGVEGQPQATPFATHPDIIVIAPPPAWLAGGSAGLAREDLARTLGLLAPAGTLAVRLRPVDLGAREFASILAAFTEACPASSLWYDGDGLLLVGWAEAPRLDLATLEARFRAAADRANSGLAQATDVLAHFVMPAAGLRVIASSTPADAIARPGLALAAPPSGDQEGERLLARLASLPDDVLALFADLDARELDELRTRLEPAARAHAHLMAAQGLAAADRAAALGHAEQALALRPDDPLARERAARLLFAGALESAGAGRGAEALERAERALALDPGVEDHGLLVFDLLGRAGREAQAGRLLDTLAAGHPQSYPVQLLLAQRRLDAGDVNAGELFLRRAAETGFETADLVVGFARVAFARGDTTGGRRLVRQAAALGPDPAAVFAYAGGRLLADGQLDAAGALLRESRDLGLENADVLGALGELALQRRDLPEARRMLQAAVAAAPGLPILRAQLGSVLIISGDPAGALPHLEEAVRQIPGDPLVRLNLAVALARVGRVEDSRREVVAIGDRLPDNPVLLRLREDLGVTSAAPTALRPGALGR